VTIDTLRADRVGAYGHAGARTPSLDAVARAGARFERAFAAAPITLPSHASLLTGVNPPGHASRHNGMRVGGATPTLAVRLRDTGFATAAFVAAFPLDRRFGLDAGFEVYSDRMPRRPDGRSADERPGRLVVDEAIAWWRHTESRRRFLWVHLFEPHAPYGDPAAVPARPVLARYDDEVAIADRELGRLLAAIAGSAAQTLLVVASDHGEAFGEHGEVAHSLFVYDTTLRVPLLLRGPGIPPGLVVPDRVGLVDVAPTVTRLLQVPELQGDGTDLAPALNGRALPPRDLYAESFAPLLDFGWSPLRSLRSGRWKAIEAPRPELYDVSGDPGEARDVAAHERVLDDLLARLAKLGPPEMTFSPTMDAEARSRLSALGYVQGGGGRRDAKADPKDRRAEAARMALAVSGEVRGEDLLALLQAIVRDDPGNGQARLRLGYGLLEAGRPREAEAHFLAAIEAAVPSADPYLGLAVCLGRRGAAAQALEVLRKAEAAEPGNPVVLANIGIAEAQRSRWGEAVSAFDAALAIDPDLHEARFHLAIAHARGGHRDRAAREASELLRRLPADAPQRREVERLAAALH
jgi:arylsulfatase A-like enzyme/Tfp pilus assembly protein PilF